MNKKYIIIDGIKYIIEIGESPNASESLYAKLKRIIMQDIEECCTY